MKLTKEQRAELADELALPWGRVYLQCDGDKIALLVRQVRPLKFEVHMYINGWFKGEWMQADKPVREQRYLRKSVRQMYSAAVKAKAEKEAGKRFVKKYLSGTITLFDPTWSSGRAVIAHLCKVCDSIEILTNDELKAPAETPATETVAG
jgi:hypothetical protein